ncbi:MAG TPA: hypothetical protein VGC29_00705 [Flavisolibacter sp.]
MKKLTSLKTLGVIVGALVASVALMQCTKTGEGAVIKNLDRAMNTVPDSGVFSSFYDTTIVSKSDLIPDVNDRIITRGVRTIIRENCATATCHGGPIAPKLNTYAEIIKHVIPGSPEGSKLFNLITTNNFQKAMPPVATTKEVSLSDKVILYNWIRNGAKETPGLNDFRPAAVKLLVMGCGSANCHNQATAVGAWAKKGLLGDLSASDTSNYIFISPTTGSRSTYCQVRNKTILNQVWTAYKDSVKKFYSDTIAFASYRPYKTFTSPWTLSSVRGPLSDYDDIIMDIMYPKSVRSNSTIQFTENGNKYYVKGNPLNATSSMLSRVDSTLILANPYTGVFATKHQGDMAYGDGGLRASEIALIKAWYFADPNIPAVWKYGLNNAGIFKYKKSGNIIQQ